MTVTLAGQATFQNKMSTSEIDCDGFQKVKSKNRTTRNKPTKLPPKQELFDKQELQIDIPKVIQRIHAAVEDLKVSDYLNNVLESVSSVLVDQKVVEIVCFGLGHLSQCNISRYQLAFLLCLKERFKPLKVLVHDPIFYKNECEVLHKLGLKVIAENNEGSYIINDLTLVYLPHCPKQLTNNFLWSNWGSQLKNSILICNSFTSLINNQPSRVLQNTVPYICKIFPHVTEIPLQNNFKFTDIFNDTSVHYFSKEIHDKLDSEFWVKGDKPSYNNTEEFITSLMVQKLNI